MYKSMTVRIETLSLTKRYVGIANVNVTQYDKLK